jgi:hypothetical protein
MSDCASIQDRIPLVANGVAEWTAEESAHLAACADCAADWRTVAVARRLGDTAANRVDAVRVSRTVIARLASDRVARRWRRGGWVAGLAAAAAVVLMVRVASAPGRTDAVTPQPVSTALHVPLAELETLNTDELESVLDGLDQPIGSGAAPDAPRLGDLDDLQLERVLRSLEG